MKTVCFQADWGFDFAKCAICRLSGKNDTVQIGVKRAIGTGAKEPDKALPADENPAPGESAAHGFHEYQMPLLDPSILQCGIQSEWN